MERWHAKAIVALIVFTVTEIATLLPLKVSIYFKRMGSKGITIISYMMCFGGGVFLGLYMLHMAPDVREILRVSLIIPYKIDYPLADFIMAIGFFMMLFLEKAMIKMQKKYRKKKRHGEETVIVNKNTDRNLTTSERGYKEPRHEVVQFETSFNSHTNNQTSIDKDQPITVNGMTETEAKAIQEDHSAGVLHHDHGHVLVETRSLILLLALSLHHVFEGMTVGLSYTTTAVWNLTIAILSHEVVIAFSLGLQLVHAYKNRKTIILAATMCSTMTPLGVIIGTLIMEIGNMQGEANLEIVNGCLQGIFTGVFIYITFFEILGGEISHDDSSMIKIVFILLGFLVLAGLGLVPEEKPQFRVMPDYNSTDTLMTLCNVTTG